MNDDNDKKDKINSNPYDFEMLDYISKSRLEKTKEPITKERKIEHLLVVNTLFKIFLGTYGRQFAEQYDNNFTKDLWFTSLIPYSKIQITKAIEAVLNDEFVTPPNLKKFITYCEKTEQKNNGRLPRLKIGVNTN